MLVAVPGAHKSKTDGAGSGGGGCLGSHLQRRGIPAKIGETLASIKGLNQMSM